MTRRRWHVMAIGLALAAMPAGAAALGGWFVPQATPAQRLARDLAGRRLHQVSIEQHLIIRITPADPATLRDMPPPAPEPLPARLRQRPMARCMAVGALAGVRPLAANRLLLVLRDRRLVAADLSRNCVARDFYMGFYITPTADGQVCVGRDPIHSRAGTTCTITQVHELVATN